MTDDIGPLIEDAKCFMSLGEEVLDAIWTYVLASLDAGT
jgi:hypothetical protein